MGKLVFVSYSRSDLAYVRRLVDHLTAEGFDVWWDSNLESGTRFPEMIQSRINESDAFIIILSPHSIASDWVNNELHFAIDSGKTVLPLLLRPCRPPIQIISLHRIDVTEGQMPDAQFTHTLRSAVTAEDSARTSTSASASTFSLAALSDPSRIIRIAGPPLVAHQHGIKRMDFNPDASRLAAASLDGTVRLWDPSFGRLVGKPMPGDAMSFSPGGRRLATVSFGSSLQLWDSATGRQVGNTYVGSILRAEFSPDGTRIACAGDGAFALLNAVNGRVVNEPSIGDLRTIPGFSFSADATRLATVALGQPIRLWDAFDGGQITALADSHDLMIQITHSPDGRRIAGVGLNGKIRLWDTASHSMVGDLVATEMSTAASIQFSLDGTRLLTIAPDDPPRLWDPGTAQPIGDPLIGVERGGFGSHRVARFSPDGSRLGVAVRDKIISAGEDRAVHLWNPASAKRVGSPLVDHHGTIFSMAFSPDASLLATVGKDGIVRFWDPVNARPVRARLASHVENVFALAFSPDGRKLATGSEDATVRLWQVAHKE